MCSHHAKDHTQPQAKCKYSLCQWTLLNVLPCRDNSRIDTQAVTNHLQYLSLLYTLINTITEVRWIHYFLSIYLNWVYFLLIVFLSVIHFLASYKTLWTTRILSNFLRFTILLSPETDAYMNLRNFSSVNSGWGLLWTTSEGLRKSNNQVASYHTVFEVENSDNTRSVSENQ